MVPLKNSAENKVKNYHTLDIFSEKSKIIFLAFELMINWRILIKNLDCFTFGNLF